MTHGPGSRRLVVVAAAMVLLPATLCHGALAAGYVAADSLPPARIQLVYDASIPDTARSYLEDLAARVLPVLTEVLGPPVVSQTLTVSLDPTVGAFAYRYAPPGLSLSRVPAAELGASNPVNLDFNANFVHELAHAYQAQYAYLSPAWFHEGFAQAAADLVKDVLRERGQDLLQNTTIGEDAAIRTYDSMARVGPEVLTHLYGKPGRFLSYTNAEGMWWLLLLSQSTRRKGFSYAGLDYFRGVEARISKVPLDPGDAAWQNLMASASRYPVDGVSVADWLQRQPAARTAPAHTVLGFYPADCLCPDASSAMAQHLIIVLQRDGVSLNGTPVRVVIRDELGERVSDETVPFRDFGFGFFRYAIPASTETLKKGRYDITVGATVDGVPMRAVNSMVVGIVSRSAPDGLGIYALPGPDLGADTLQVTVHDGSYVRVSGGAGLVRPAGEPRIAELRFRINGRRDAAIFFPAPYTRFVGVRGR